MMDDRTFGLNIAALAIRAAAVGVSLYSAIQMAKQIEKGMSMFRRTEIEPNAAGKLLVKEIVNDKEVSVRYATEKEEWDYSYKNMVDQLVRMGYL